MSTQVKIIKEPPSGYRWKPDPYMKLPRGARVKVLRRDRKNNVLDMLIRWPEGYVEPRHTHTSTHSVVVLQGRVIVEGKELRKGGYIYGPSGKAHGPFEWHDDCIVFVHFEGNPTHHYKRDSAKTTRSRKSRKDKNSVRASF